ncbi:hypothetical protein FMEXI_8947 [Fusarium mexicanum]|uniref:BZIP domain-containing protein n=1 Tax=Fusarium mexicanum TaxID=751941 RepID=A0A8H5ILM6_9HYPO|nr:hypothetical protein FMEXI_8947 [Fusarium mexicanum]
MSVFGSQSGLSEQTLSDADDSNIPVQDLVETIDRRKTQNRIAQRKHRQKLKKRIEELELQLEYANFNSRSVVPTTSPHPIPMPGPSYSDSIEENVLPHFDHIENLFTKSNGHLGSFWNAQEHSALSGASLSLGHFTTPLPPASMSPLQTQNLTGDSPLNRGFTHTSARHGIELPTASHLMTPTTEINEVLTVPDASRRSSLHPLSEAPELDDPSAPPCSWTMERKIAYIVDCTKSLGFRDFDSVVKTYYTSSFEVMSRAHDMQRVSRLRGLDSVLRTVNASAETWPHHESQIYQAEVFKAAKHLYRVEFQRAIDSGALMVLEQHQRLREDEMNWPAVRLTSHKSELLSQSSQDATLQDPLPRSYVTIYPIRET